MLYYFLKILMRLVLPVYYRKISIEGRTNIPASGPAILACTHPNSFLDAIVIGTYTPRKLHFLTRSDVFNAPWKRWILGKMNMVPIYRMRDGMENLDKNQETFEKCRQVLSAGGVILIFSEGLCIQEMKLRPLKKGTARIALDFAQYGKSIHVVPIALNYLYPMKPRKEVAMGVAPSFDALPFAASYRDNPAKAILAFNRELEARLRTQVVEVNDRAHEYIFQQTLELLMMDRVLSLSQLKKVAERYNGLMVDAKGSTLTMMATEYFTLIRQGRLSDRVVARSSTFSPMLLPEVTVFLPGLLLFWIPLLAAYQLAKRKVKLKEFIDSVRVAGGMIFSLVFSIILLVTLATLSWQWALVALGALPLFAWLSPKGYDGVVRYAQATRFQLLAGGAQRLLKNKRKELTAFVEANLLHD